MLFREGLFEESISANIRMTKRQLHENLREECPKQREKQMQRPSGGKKHGTLKGMKEN